MLPVESSSPTLSTASDVSDDLPPMEMIIGLVVLGVLLLTSAILLSIIVTVCVCRQVVKSRSQALLYIAFCYALKTWGAWGWRLAKYSTGNIRDHIMHAPHLV